MMKHLKYAMAAGLLGLSGAAHAGTVDVLTPSFGLIEDISQLNFEQTPDFIDVEINLGGDGVFNTGDTFTQTLNLNWIGGVINGVTTFNPYTGNVGAPFSTMPSDLSLIVELSGTVSVSGGSALTEACATAGTCVADQEFGVNFTGGGGTLFAGPLDAQLGPVGSFGILSGGADLAFGITSDFIINFQLLSILQGLFFDSAPGVGVSGDDFFDRLMAQEIILGVGFATGQLQGVLDNGDSNDGLIFIRSALVANTAEIIFVPEPAPLAVIGFGLLALAGMRRRKA